MMKVSRLNQIKEYVLSKEYVSLDELCQVFDRSKNTIRRDIGELTHSGTIQKVYGGVKAVKQEAPPLISFQDRNVKNVAQKRKIGAIAARFVQDNDVIFIDSGSTTVNIVEHLTELSGVTVLTNNLHAILRCMEVSSINVIALGGQLSRDTSSFSAKFCALDNLRRFNISKAFMAATGVSTDTGATHTSPEEFEIKKDIMEKSDTCFLLADSSKFDQSALLTYSELTAFKYVITDSTPPKRYNEYFSENGIQLLTK